MGIGRRFWVVSSIIGMLAALMVAPAGAGQEAALALADGVRKARATRTVIKQNLGWAILYNISAVPLAAAGLVAPWMAAIGMSFSSLVVVFNALRLKSPD